MNSDLQRSRFTLSRTTPFFFARGVGLPRLNLISCPTINYDERCAYFYYLAYGYAKVQEFYRAIYYFCRKVVWINSRFGNEKYYKYL
jgi:hypothetical protein